MSLQVLLVEDSPGDVRLMQEAFHEVNEGIRLRVTSDGCEAIYPYRDSDHVAGGGDVVKSYQLHANCYFSKPVQLDAFDNLIKSINDFWLTKVTLPPGHSA